MRSIATHYGFSGIQGRVLLGHVASFLGCALFTRPRNALGFLFVFVIRSTSFVNGFKRKQGRGNLRDAQSSAVKAERRHRRRQEAFPIRWTVLCR